MMSYREFLDEVSFQGEIGSYSEVAARLFAPRGKPRPCIDFADVFENVLGGKTPLGIVPVENSLHGAVVEVNDHLIENSIHVVGEVVLPISHCLLAPAGTKLDEIKRVVSHPQALGQCRRFLRSRGITPEAVYDTAGAAKRLAETRETHTAAIASHRAGSLLKVLQIFAAHEINLTRLESRPVRSSFRTYGFLVDFHGSSDDPMVKSALTGVQHITEGYRFLGCYPESPWPRTSDEVATLVERWK